MRALSKAVFFLDLIAASHNGKFGWSSKSTLISGTLACPFFETFLESRWKDGVVAMVVVGIYSENSTKIRVFFLSLASGTLSIRLGMMNPLALPFRE